MNTPNLIILIFLFAFTANNTYAKKPKEIDILRNKVEYLTHKSDSLEKVILLQKLEISEKINKTLRSYNDLKKSYDELSKRIDKVAPTFQIVGSLYSGRALAKDGAKYGYVDADGQMVISARFEHACDFEYGCAIVKLNDKWGVINTSGEIVIPCLYTYIDSYNSSNNVHNLYIVKSDNGLWGVVAPGKVVQDYVYTNISRVYNSNIAECSKDGMMGILDEKGDLIIPVKYREIFSIGNDTYKIKGSDRSGLIVDLNGKILKRY